MQTTTPCPTPAAPSVTYPLSPSLDVSSPITLPYIFIGVLAVILISLSLILLALVILPCRRRKAKAKGAITQPGTEETEEVGEGKDEGCSLPCTKPLLGGVKQGSGSSDSGLGGSNCEEGGTRRQEDARHHQPWECGWRQDSVSSDVTPDDDCGII